MLVSGFFDIFSSLLSLLVYLPLNVSKSVCYFLVLIILIFPYCDLLPVSNSIAIAISLIVLVFVLHLTSNGLLNTFSLSSGSTISCIEYSWVTFFDRGSYSATIFLPLLVRFCVVRTSVCPHLFYDRNDWLVLLSFIMVDLIIPPPLSCNVQTVTTPHIILLSAS